jgi:hypothetical protein
MKQKNRNRNKTARKLKRKQRNVFRNKTKNRKQSSRRRFVQMGGEGMLERVVEMIMSPLPSGIKSLTPDNTHAIKIRIDSVMNVIKHNPQVDFTGNTKPGENNPNGNTMLYAVTKMRPFTSYVSLFVKQLAERCHVNNVGNRVNESRPPDGLVQTLKDVVADQTQGILERWEQVKNIEASLVSLTRYGADMTLKNNIDNATALDDFIAESNNLTKLLYWLEEQVWIYKEQERKPSARRAVERKADQIRMLLTPPHRPSPEPLINISTNLANDIGFITHVIDDIREPHYSDIYYESIDERRELVSCTWYFISGNFRYHFKKQLFDQFQIEYNKALNNPDKIRGVLRLEQFLITSEKSSLKYQYKNFQSILFDTTKDELNKLLPTLGFEYELRRPDGMIGYQRGWIEIEFLGIKHLYPLYQVVNISPPLHPHLLHPLHPHTGPVLENDNVRIAQMLSNPPYNLWTIITPTARRPSVGSTIHTNLGFYLDKREQYYFINDNIRQSVDKLFKNQQQQETITVNGVELTFFRNEKGVPTMRVYNQTYTMFSTAYGS